MTRTLASLLSVDPFENQRLPPEAKAAAIEHVERFRAEMGDLFDRIAAVFGADGARSIWLAALPHGSANGHRKHWTDAFVDQYALALDRQCRDDLGMTAIDAAEHVHKQLGFSENAEAARRSLDRLKHQGRSAREKPDT